MTTSGLIDSTMTVGEVVTAAMQEMGVLAANEAPTAEEMTLGIRTLNWTLKSLQVRGANLWRATNGVVVFPANGAGGTLLPDIQAISTARVLQSANYERPLFRYERDEYMTLPNKAAPGNPTIYYADDQRDNINLYVWPVPTVDTTITLDYVRRIQDVTDDGETIDVPQQWLETVYINLAARLCSTFGVTRVDPATAQSLAARATGMERVMLDNDRPASYFMGTM